MVLEGKTRRFSGAVFGANIAISALAVGAFIPTSAAAQTGEPIKIGYSMALTGGLAPNGTFDVMHSRATDRRSASKCQGKWPGQTLDQAFGLPRC